MLKPRALNPSSKIAIISASMNGMDEYAYEFATGIKFLQEILHFKPIVFPSVRMTWENLEHSPKLRAEEINHAFRDPQIDAILFPYGGYDSYRILKYIDIELVIQNPKIVIGFSDLTNLLLFLNQLGLVTYYGPMVIEGFAQANYFPESTQYYYSFFMKNVLQANIHQFTQWTDRTNLPLAPSHISDTKELIWLQGNSALSGKIFGGCLETLAELLDTPYWPDSNFLKCCFLLLETSSEKPKAQEIGDFLIRLNELGMMKDLNGLLFGRLIKYSEQEMSELSLLLIDICFRIFGHKDFTIVLNISTGHTYPQSIIPLGIEMCVDSVQQKIYNLEEIFLPT